ncbi:MAG: Mur ligase family protein [Anaerolineae bacterium]|nr:Mur ligase family protein [Anaerolineae bacterium]
MSSFASTLADFRAQEQWLLSLIRDPEGLRFNAPRSAAEYRQRDYERIERMAAFMAFIGNPQRHLRAVQVAGTSGKGSVTTMIATLLTACGQRTADHISPYLQVCNEKLRLDGQMIAPSEFADLVREFRRLYGAWGKAGGDLHYGEAWVALTLLWFVHKNPDWAVMETGRGGRFDPTIVMPIELAVITNVDFDHVTTLGPELTDIAWHKAGIIRPNTPVITAATHPDVLTVIRREAEQKNAPLFELNFNTNSDGTLTIDAPYNLYSNLALDLSEGFQVVNAALAVAAVDVLAHDFDFTLDNATIEHALSGCVVPGRLETMQASPTVIIDGAHNPHKMRALAESLRARYPDRRITTIVGMIARKEADGMIEAIRPITDRFIATQPHVFGKPGQPHEFLAERIRTVAPESTVATAPGVQAALDLALQNAQPNDIIVVTGSIYLVGAARERWFPTAELLQNLEANR